MRTRRTKAAGSASSTSGFDCAKAFQKIVRGSVAGIQAHHSSACAGDAEAVHQIRVAITRLRAAVAFFAPIVVDAEWLRIKKEIAWLNIALGAARDSDVSMQYAVRKRYQSWAKHRVSEQLDQRRTRDHRRLVRCLRSNRFHRLVEMMSTWIERGAWLTPEGRMARGTDVEPLKVYSARRLNRWRRRLVRKGRRLDELNGSQRHRLRIRTKRFRYMLEALTEIVVVRNAREFRHLRGPAKRLQRTLGDLRDLKRFAGLAVSSSGEGKRRKRRPPGYRNRRKVLLRAAIEAARGLDRTGAC